MCLIFVSFLVLFDERSVKVIQKETKEQLRSALSTLPTPKNEYEIVVNEDDEINGEVNDQSNLIEDQADIDARREADLLAAALAEKKKQSQSVQRDLPRPSEVTNILRQSNEPLTELQRAEELIKEEMLTMLHHDSIRNPTNSQMFISSIRAKQGGNPNQQHLLYLDKHPFVKYDEEDISNAKQMLSNEIEVVKQGMGHDLTFDAFCQVWDECLSQVLYVPSQNKYTRANHATKKERIESLEKRLEQNRNHMTKEAKQAAKIEKKLKILLGGYQSRAQTLVKQIQDLVEQIEQTHLELDTFKMLKNHENNAIHKRIQVSFFLITSIK